MKSKSPKKKLARRKRILRLPDLDHAKIAVLITLSSPDSQRSYRFAIDDFIAWYCSEPRLALNKTVVLHYKLQLKARHLASSIINLSVHSPARTIFFRPVFSMAATKFLSSQEFIEDRSIGV